MVWPLVLGGDPFPDPLASQLGTPRQPRGQIEPAPVRLVVIKMMNCHCGTIPVVEGEARLNGMLMVRDVLLPLSRARGMRVLRFNNTC